MTDSNPQANDFRKTPINQALNSIQDVFTGVGGCVPYIKLRNLIQNLHSRAENNDKEAQEILKIVFRFNNLIQYAIKNVPFGEENGVDDDG